MGETFESVSKRFIRQQIVLEKEFGLGKYHKVILVSLDLFIDLLEDHPSFKLGKA